MNIGFTSYWFYGDAERLISTHDARGLYFINNFLDIYSSAGEVFELFFRCEPAEEYPFLFDCPFISCTEEDMAETDMSHEYIEEKTRGGEYILAFINRSYIGHYSGFIGAHQMMVTGFDRARDEVIFCDNDRTGRYSSDMRCPYDEFIRGYNHVRNLYSKESKWLSKVFLLKGKPCGGYSLDRGAIAASLKSYSEGRNGKGTSIRYTYDGINCYEALTDNLALPYDDCMRGLHMGAYSVLREHKAVMALACAEAAREYGISPEYAAECQSIMRSIGTAENLVVMYVVSEGARQAARASDSLKSALERERSLTEKLIKELK